jgi:YggT family protein
MILMANFLIASARVLHILIVLYTWVVILRAILSWFNVPSLYRLNVVLYYLTEPVLRPLRKLIPPYKLGGIDVSPVIAVLALLFIDSFLVKSLALYGARLLHQNPVPF